MTDAPAPEDGPVEAAMIALAEEARLRDPRLAEGVARLAPLLTEAVSRYCGAATPVAPDGLRFGALSGLAAALEPAPHPAADSAGPTGRWAAMSMPGRADRAHLWMDDRAIRTFLSRSLRVAEGDAAAAPPSKVERRMIARIAEVIGRCVRRAFVPEGPDGATDLVPADPRPDPRDLSGPGASVLFTIGDGEGQLALLLPVDGPAAPPRGPLAPLGTLSPPLADARLRVAATVPCRVVTLGAAMAWEPGTFVEFGADPSGPVRVTVGGTPLFEGEVGQDGGPDLACRITAPFPLQEAP